MQLIRVNATKRLIKGILNIYYRHYNIYQTIFIEKTDAILLLESANDQLLKVKKDNEERIAELARLLENEKKENYVMKLKTADLFRVKKDLEESRKTTQLYQ